MPFQAVKVVTVAIATFIPWLISKAAVDALLILPRVLFVLVHYALVVLLFWIAFSWYYRRNKGVDPFTVMIVSMLSFFVFELLYLGWTNNTTAWTLTYLHWFVPTFLIASTIFWTGKFFPHP